MQRPLDGLGDRKSNGSKTLDLDPLQGTGRYKNRIKSSLLKRDSAGRSVDMLCAPNRIIKQGGAALKFVAVN